MCVCVFKKGQKSLVSVNFFARNSGAGNGCANFMSAWKNCVLSAGNLHAHKIPRFRGGDFGFFGGGGRFYFIGTEIFLKRFCAFSCVRKRWRRMRSEGWLCNSCHRVAGWSKLRNENQPKVFLHKIFLIPS